MPTGTGSVVRRVDLPFVVVADHLVVFDPVREQAHLLNHSAAAVWQRFEGGSTVDETVLRLADRYGLDTETLRPEVASAVAELTVAGLLAAGSPPAVEPLTDSAETDRTTVPDGYDEDRPWAYRSDRRLALEVGFRIESTDQLLGEFLERVLAPLRGPAATAAPAATGHSWTYRIWPAADDPERFVVATEHESLTVSSARGDAASTVLWHYNRDVIEHTRHLLLFHSAAVADDHGVLALPAVANSGKSTLATLLVRAGYRYLTDEALAVDPDTLLVHPYPKPIGLDPGSFPLFPDLEPTEKEQPPELFHHKWWLDPRRISPHGDAAVPAEPIPLQAVVFPTYDAEAEPSIAPVEPAEGVVLLARNTFNLKRWGQRGLDVLARIATEVPLYTMTHNDLDATLHMLADVIGPPASALDE